MANWVKLGANDMIDTDKMNAVYYNPNTSPCDITVYFTYDTGGYRVHFDDSKKAADAYKGLEYILTVKQK